MARMADSCTKEAILPVLMSNPNLYIPNEMAYQNWILFGLDLGISGRRLQEIKDTAMAKGAALLHGIVTELIEEWFAEKNRTGKNASITALVEALKENHLESFGEAIQSAFLSSEPDLNRSASSMSVSSTEPLPACEIESQQDQQQKQTSLAIATPFQPQQQPPDERKSDSASISSSASIPRHSNPDPQRDKNNEEGFLGKKSSRIVSYNSSSDQGKQDLYGINVEKGSSMPGNQPTARVEKPGFPLGLSVFHLAVKENRREDVLKLISTGGVNINAVTNDKHRSTALHLATKTISNREDAIKMIKVLIDAGAKVDLVSREGYPFTDGLFFIGGSNNLQKPTWQQFEELMKILIESGNKSFLETPYVFGKGSGSVLHWAMKEGILGRPTIKFLHSKNVNLNCLSTSGHSLLYYAISGLRSIETIYYLIHFGADWKQLNKFNEWNLLHVSARYCHLPAFKHFLRKDPNWALAKTKEGLTAVELLKMHHSGRKEAALMIELVELQSKVKVEPVEVQEEEEA